MDERLPVFVAGYEPLPRAIRVEDCPHHEDLASVKPLVEVFLHGKVLIYFLL